MSPSSLRLALLADGDHVNIQRWNTGLQAAGAKTIVLSLTTHRSRERSDTHHLPTIHILGRLNYVLTVPIVRRILRAWQPDVILSYYVTGYGTLGRLTGFHPLVQVTSGSDILLASRHPIMGKIVRRNLKEADLVTAWAPHMADAARASGARDVFVLPAGIDIDRFSAYQIPEPMPYDPIRLIISRSLKAFYRIDLLVEAARILASEQTPFSLTIAGDGPEYARLANMIDAYGLNNQVQLIGFVPNQSLPVLLSQHNTYISLVPSDGVSASLLEAMAVGLLPIVPRNPANADWITDDENGLLISDVTPEGIAASIQRINTAIRFGAWHRNPAIVAERADLYQNAKAYVEKFRLLVRA